MFRIPVDQLIFLSLFHRQVTLLVMNIPLESQQIVIQAVATRMEKVVAQVAMKFREAEAHYLIDHQLARVVRIIQSLSLDLIQDLVLLYLQL